MRIKMAASMRKLMFVLRESQLRSSMVRSYSRRQQKGTRVTLTPSEDIQKLSQKKTIIDPRNNPFIAYNPVDPVQRSMTKFANKTYANEKTKSNEKKNVHRTANDIKQPVEVEEVQKNLKHKKTCKNTPARKREHIEMQNKPNSDDHSKERNREDGVEYEWLEKGDRTLSTILVHAKSKKGLSEGLIVIEGKETVLRALHLGVKLKYLFFSSAQKVDFLKSIDYSDASVYKTSFKELKLWTDLKDPEGFIGVFEMPEEGTAMQHVSHTVPVSLIFDRVTDPEQLAMLLNTAAGIGCQQIIATRDCCSMWHADVLRQSDLAPLRIPTYCEVPWNKLPALLPGGEQMRVLVADSRQLTGGHRRHIEGSVDVVSRLEELYQEGLEEDVTTDTTSTDSTDTDIQHKSTINYKVKKRKSILDSIESDVSYSDETMLNLYNKAPLNIVNSYDLDVRPGDHVVLVVSGGGYLAPQTRKLVYDSYGHYVSVPGQQASFAFSVTGSIILYELANKLRTEHSLQKQTFASAE
ncbi:rRNA methyltransferase 3, mitochondrial-like [Mya arenaria]|uniref:rRNA methyltransferase 3, mitochondrial-like n=1 Tax=Mya arenaria TaxID=6604 RepID=UPI0022E2E96D|nr:rRNA methyltransferase 3, mitochondrial-like [Mya arenaria]